MHPFQKYSTSKFSILSECCQDVVVMLSFSYRYLVVILSRCYQDVIKILSECCRCQKLYSNWSFGPLGLGIPGPWDPWTLGPLNLETLGPWDFLTSLTFFLLHLLLILPLTYSYLFLLLSSWGGILEMDLWPLYWSPGTSFFFQHSLPLISSHLLLIPPSYSTLLPNLLLSPHT